MTDRKHPSVAFWVTVALFVLLVGYPLSFGPACWLTARIGGRDFMDSVYWPIGWLGCLGMTEGTQMAHSTAIIRYGGALMPPGAHIKLRADFSGHAFIGIGNPY